MRSRPEERNSSTRTAKRQRFKPKDSRRSTANDSGSFSLQLPAAASPADPDADVFFDLQQSKADLESPILWKNEPFLFIRAGVATGKSTMVNFLKKYENYVVVNSPFPRRFENWVGEITKSVSDRCNNKRKDSAQLREALSLLGSSVTLVFDEGHLLFANTDLCEQLFKLRQAGEPKILLFSASGEAKKANSEESAVTPQNITRKFVWRPQVPDAKDVQKQLEKAGVYLNFESVQLVFNICGGHYGISMCAMRWIKSIQKGEKWNYDRTLSSIRAALSGVWAGEFLTVLAKCRAVKANSEYSEILNIPAEFCQIAFGGAMLLSPTLSRRLSIAGMVLPVNDHQHGKNPVRQKFTFVNWTQGEILCEVASPLMGSYYQHVFKDLYGTEFQSDKRVPTSCVDLLARVLPHLYFHRVMCTPIPGERGELQSPASKQKIPHECDYQNAIVSTLKQTLEGFDAGTPMTKGGHVDLYVKVINNGKVEKTYSIELIMAARGPADHEKHLQRFFEESKPNYRRADHKAIVTIGKQEAVHSMTAHLNDILNGAATAKTEALKKAMNKSKRESIGIIEPIGLEVSSAHDYFGIYCRRATSKLHSHVIPVDGVSRALGVDGVVLTAVNVVEKAGLTRHNKLQQEQLQAQKRQRQLEERNARLEEQKLQAQERQRQLEERKTRLEEQKLQAQERQRQLEERQRKTRLEEQKLQAQERQRQLEERQRQLEERKLLLGAIIVVIGIVVYIYMSIYNI